MYFDRNLPREEVYVTFSFSLVLGPDGRIDGLFCAGTETTEMIIGNRRLEMLRKLALQSSEARTLRDVCAAVANVLREKPHGVPFSAIYLVDEVTVQARLAASTGLVEGDRRLPEAVAPDEDPAASPWPIAAHANRRHAARAGLRVPTAHPQVDRTGTVDGTRVRATA